MIGRLNKLCLLLLLASCGVPEKEETPEFEEEIVLLDIPVVDAERFVDFVLAGEQEVLETENGFAVVVDESPNEILTYEGKLMSAKKIPDGYQLELEPYEYWDDDLEMTVKSQTNFRITIEITEKQADYLGYFEDAPITENIKWDYYENLFTIFFYLDGDRNNVPLKFQDEGKTEWDG